MKNKLMKKVLTGSLVVGSAVAMTACSGDSVAYPDGYTYNTYTMVSPSNWNELTYQDNNDTQIMNYIGSSFFNYDFLFDENGEIVSNDFDIKYEAATDLKDVTSTYKTQWNLSHDNHRAYEITLRDDLTWDDGTAIDAHDFIYSMEQQLDPEFLHYRADSYYTGTSAIVGAGTYAKGGLIEYAFLDTFVEADLVKDSNGIYKFTDGKDAKIALEQKLAINGNKYTLEFLAGYFLSSEDYAEFVSPIWDLADPRGYVNVTDESIELMEDAVACIVETAGTSAYVGEWSDTLVKEDITNEKVSFEDTVGLFATSDYKLVIIFANQLDLLDSEGNLTYKAAYNMSSLPLVKEDLYESCKKDPVTGSTIKTTNYNSSKATTASWGPYSLDSFQSGKQYVLERNNNWFGYDLEENEGLYQTDRIVCETVKDWNTAWLLFQAGKVDSIGIDVSISAEYKTSERAMFTPSSFIQSIQIQSNESAIKKYSSETANVSTVILLEEEFREAISLSIDRQDYTAKNTTSSKAGFGLFNTVHYIDVANGVTYRSTDAAKRALLETYSVDESDFDNLDDAVASITGYNVTLAKELFQTAYDNAIATGLMSSTDTVPLRIVTGGITESTTRQAVYLEAALQEATKGTGLEGKITVTESDSGSAWADDFRDGAGELTLGGWSGAAWDPGYFLLAYIDEDYMYSTGWDTANHMMTFTMPSGSYAGAGITHTMSMLDWYDCLNGASTATYNWNASSVDQSVRVELIAEMEKEILAQYYTVPLLNSFSATLLSYKVEYITYEYNTFMGYGGIKYMTYNFNNGDWASKAKDADYRA